MTHLRIEQLLAKAVALQAQRDHTRYELERKLMAWASRLVAERSPGAASRVGWSSESQANRSSESEALRPLVHQVLDQLQERGWQSDSRFAANWVSQRQGREGARKLLAGLKQRGVADSALVEVQAQAGENELERARDLVARRLNQRAVQSLQERARLMRYLAGRGFSLSVAQKAVPVVGREVDLSQED